MNLKPKRKDGEFIIVHKMFRFLCGTKQRTTELRVLSCIYLDECFCFSCSICFW